MLCLEITLSLFGHRFALLSRTVGVAKCESSSDLFGSAHGKVYTRLDARHHDVAYSSFRSLQESQKLTYRGKVSLKQKLLGVLFFFCFTNVQSVIIISIFFFLIIRMNRHFLEKFAD